MRSELLAKIALLKQKVADTKTAPILQKSNRLQAAIDEAVYIIEDLATEQVRLEALLDDLVTDGLGLEARVNGE